MLGYIRRVFLYDNVYEFWIFDIDVHAGLWMCFMEVIWCGYIVFANRKENKTNWCKIFAIGKKNRM